MHRILVWLLVSVIYESYNAPSMVVGLQVNTTLYAISHRCAWLPCNMSDFSSPYYNYSLDCCTLLVPLNYDKPGRNISLAMSRLTPSQPTAKNNTLFALMGGPGGSGWSLLRVIAHIIPATFGFTIVLPDHRGTGWSTPLGCDDNMSQNITVACIPYLTSQWGVEGLNQFSVTAAAHDLSVLVQSYQADQPGRIAVLGLSYGTFLLDRFLQIYPTLVQSAIMDGVWNPLTSSISRYGLGASAVGSQFLGYCLSDPRCSRYFPAKQPPHIMLLNMLHEIDSNDQKCIKNHFDGYGIDSATIRNVFFDLINGAELYMDRTVIPAVIYRLNRCNEDDVTALQFFFRTTLGLPQSKQEQVARNAPGFSYVSLPLQQNIIQSEEWLARNEPEIDLETFSNWYQSGIMDPNAAPLVMSLRSQWPKYPIDQYRFKLASYSPLLMISGQLDPATPFDHLPQLAAITSRTRTFYGIPLAGHVTLSMAEVGYLCPLHLICSWAFPDLFPMEWRDPKCIQDLPTTIDFVGATELGQKYSLKLLNTTRPFGDNSTESVSNSGNRRLNFVQLPDQWFLFVYLLFAIPFT